MNAKNAAIIFGIVFLLVGVLGFVPNPVIYDSHDALFHADAVHSGVHLLSGALFLIIAFAAPAYASLFCKIFGAVYFLLGLLGMIAIGAGKEGMTQLLGFLHVNGPDNILHIVLGIVIFLGGSIGPKISRD